MVVILDEFYQMVEAPTWKVSIFWKGFHILLFIIAAVSGFSTAFAFGEALEEFDYNCIIDAEIVFDNTSLLDVGPHSDTEESEHSKWVMDLASTLWGPTSLCNFVQFTPLFTTIAAILWGTFFAILAKGGVGYPTDLLSTPWSIVYPCIFFMLITCLVLLVSSIKLYVGLLDFCEQFDPQLHNGRACIEDINAYSQLFEHEIEDEHKGFYLSQKKSIIFSQINLWSWAAQLILLIVRVCLITDFELQIVTITLKDEESDEKVVINVDAEDEDRDETSQV